MNETSNSLTKSASLTNYLHKKSNDDYLEKKHSKTIDKINQMRYSQYIKEQSTCYPYPKLSQTTKMIIQDLHNSKLMKKYSSYYQISSITRVDYSKIRSKATKRVFNLFLRNEMIRETVILLQTKAIQRLELTDNNIYNHHYNHLRCIIPNDNYNKNNQIDDNHLLIKKIIETRLRLNRTMNVKSNPLFVEVNDRKQPYKTKTSFTSKTENNKIWNRNCNRHIDLSSNLFNSNKQIGSDLIVNKPSSLISLTPLSKSSLLLKNSTINKQRDQLVTIQDSRLKDLETFFTSFKQFYKNSI